MWVFTRYGFFSAVSALKKGHVDLTRVVVRARVKSHLEGLIDQFGDLMKGVKITSSDQTDYRYRIVVRKDVWAEVMEAVAKDIDYSNFKSACGHGEYHDALTSVWSVMHGMQMREGTKSETDDDIPY